MYWWDDKVHFSQGSSGDKAVTAGNRTLPRSLTCGCWKRRVSVSTRPYSIVHVCMTRKGWASIPGTGWSPRWHGPKPGYLRRVKFTVVMALRRCDRPLRALVAESARFCEAGRALSDSRMLSPTTGAGPGFFAANRPVRRWSKFARPLEPCGAANVLYVRTRYITYIWCTLIVAGLLLPRSSPYCSGCTRGYICVEDHSRSE